MEDTFDKDHYSSIDEIEERWERTVQELRQYQSKIVKLSNTVEKQKVADIDVEYYKRAVHDYRNQYSNAISCVRRTADLGSNYPTFETYPGRRQNNKVSQLKYGLRDIMLNINDSLKNIDDKHQKALESYTKHRVGMSIVWIFIALFWIILTYGGQRWPMHATSTTISAIGSGLAFTSLIVGFSLYEDFTGLTQKSRIKVTRILNVLAFFGLVLGIISYIASIGLL